MLEGEVNHPVASFKSRNQIYSPEKIDMEPEKQPFEKENHLPNLHVGVPC